jgi:hypothetical protein
VESTTGIPGIQGNMTIAHLHISAYALPASHDISADYSHRQSPRSQLQIQSGRQGLFFCGGLSRTPPSQERGFCDDGSRSTPLERAPTNELALRKGGLGDYTASYRLTINHGNYRWRKKLVRPRVWASKRHDCHPSHVGSADVSWTLVCPEPGFGIVASIDTLVWLS